MIFSICLRKGVIMKQPNIFVKFYVTHKYVIDAANTCGTMSLGCADYTEFTL